MIYLVILISIVYIILICMVIKAYFRDVEDTNTRLIEIERRTVKLEKFCKLIGGDNMACGKKTKKATGKGGRRK